MRLLLSVAAALLLLLLAATASAQAANCTDAFPSPPTNLRARAGDGAIQLAWGPPANGACITGYQLTLVTVADGGAQGAAPVLLRVPAEQLNYTVTGLGNGQRYRVFVSGVSNKFKAGAEVQVEATPAAACNPAVTPSAPTQLAANASEAALTVCWRAPKAGCASEYRVGLRLAQPGAPALAVKRASPSQACLTFDGLEPPGANMMYDVAVQAWSARLQAGSTARLLASTQQPKRVWRCLAVAGSYPLCSAAVAGMCTPLTCAQQAALGACSAPFLRQIDAATKSIIQYCSEVCGCSADPNAAATTASTTTGIAPAAEAGAADPLVKAFDGGITAGNAAGAEAAFNAGGKSSTAWQSADGCCATKPSRKAAPGWAEEWGAEEGL